MDKYRDSNVSDNSPQVLSPENRKRKLLELLMAQGVPGREPIEGLPEGDDDFTVAQPVPMASNEIPADGGPMTPDPIEEQLAQAKRRPMPKRRALA